MVPSKNKSSCALPLAGDSWPLKKSSHLSQMLSPSLLTRPSSTIANPSKGSMQQEGEERLSAQSSAGVGATRVSKRRSRASSKPPITVLAADTTNFRAMVQKLTGIAAPPPSMYSFSEASSPLSFLKPHPCKPPYSFHGLPTLDTSALLLHTVSPQPQDDYSKTHLASSHGCSSLPSVSASDLKALFPNLISDASKKLMDGSSLKEGPPSLLHQKGSSQHSFGDKTEAAALESFLMDNENDPSSRSLHSPADSWLSPKMKLTRSA